MTEDVLESSPPSNTIIEPVMSEKTINSDEFRKPLSKKKTEKAAKRKLDSVNDKDAAHIEQKKKKKPDKAKKKKQNKGENEDATESVDSGCIADISGDVTDWPQVESAVLEERNYVLSLLSWLPNFEWVVPDLKKPKPATEESSKDESESSGKATSNKKKGEFVGTKAKLREFLNETDEIDSLRDRYTSMLQELRKGRKDKKKEGKLQRKLKNLNRRNKKNTNRQRKLEQAEIFEKKHQIVEKKKKAMLQKKIFNEKGKLVFSKFDFSSGTNINSTKAKNLELKVAKALKEREMRKQMEMEGDFKGAAELKEVEAWSGALQRADGVKVRDDLELLQKSLKKKEHRKKISKKRWEERTAAVEKKMMDKQTKRTENLKARRDAKVEKKFKKMKGKGHVVPGF
ncbi:surfeit locus protein 6 homolog isoform X2 [Palaemon carinicauda]